MDEPRDDIDTWLEERVTPLLPHPGTFEQVRKRARRRKLTQATLAAAGAAVVVAGAITVPRLVLSGGSGGAPVVASGTTPSAQATPTPARSAAGGSPGPDSRSATPAPTLPAVPANFAVSSVTFVSTTTGWVIGQAGTPGQCGPPSAYICTSIAATTNGGATWHGVPAPVAGAPNGARGVSQIRSLDGVNAWAFGPQLYATHDGGHTWTRIATHGMRVTDLETAGTRVFAVWARCTGSGTDFAGDCTSFSLYSSPAGSDAWAPVPGVTGLNSVLTAQQTPRASSAQLTLTSGGGFLFAPDGAVYTGPVDSATGWAPLNTGNSGCGVPGAPQPDGVPGSTMLAATAITPADTIVAMLCLGPVSGGQQTKTILYSQNGGRSWQTAGDAPQAGAATSLAVSVTGQVVIATTSGIDVSATAAPNPPRWRAVRGASAPGGFSYVGMTTATQGVAIPADTGLHAVWFTYDGGRHWQESPVG